MVRGLGAVPLAEMVGGRREEARRAGEARPRCGLRRWAGGRGENRGGGMDRAAGAGRGREVGWRRCEGVRGARDAMAGVGGRGMRTKALGVDAGG